MTAPAPDLARESARIFRAILHAMARPGLVVTPPSPPAPAPPGLSPAAAAAVLTLADRDAPLWLAPPLREAETLAWLRFHTGAPPADAPGGAAFALGRWVDIAPVLDALPRATPLRPDAGATLIVMVDALRDDAGARLTGPGIEHWRRLAADGLDPAFWAARRPPGAPWTQGLDAILVAGDRLAALPRTTVSEP